MDLASCNCSLGKASESLESIRHVTNSVLQIKAYISGTLAAILTTHSLVDVSLRP